MLEPWRLLIFWRPRPDSPIEVAQRLERFFELASASSTNLGSWYKTVKSVKSKLPVPAVSDYNLPELDKLIQKNRFNDDEGDPMPSGGYALGLWNGQPDSKAASMMIFAGVTGSGESYYMANSVTLGLRPDLALHGLGTDATLKRFLEAWIISWEPDWAVLFRHDYPAITNCDRSAPYLDKMAWAGPARLADAAGLAGEGVTVDVLAGGALYTRLNPPAIPPRQPIKPGRLN